jgi:hypothetical protein
MPAGDAPWVGTVPPETALSLSALRALAAAAVAMRNPPPPALRCVVVSALHWAPTRYSRGRVLQCGHTFDSDLIGLLGTRVGDELRRRKAT